MKVYIYVSILIVSLLGPPTIAASDNYNWVFDHVEDYNTYTLESIPITLLLKSMDGSVNIIIDNESIGIWLENGRVSEIHEAGFDNSVLEIYTDRATLELIAVSKNPSEDIVEWLESGDLQYSYGTGASVFDRFFLKLVIVYLRISSSFLAMAFMVAFLVALVLALTLIARSGVYSRVKQKKDKNEQVSKQLMNANVDPKAEMVLTRIKELDEEYLKGNFSKEFYEKAKRGFEKELQELQNNEPMNRGGEI